MKRNIDDAVMKFLDNGGEVIRLQSASAKDVKKSNHRFLQRDRAISGSANSEAFLKREVEREDSLIFSRSERWSK